MDVQWMKTLGPITTDYSKLTMTFQWQYKQVPLHGFIDGQLEVISSSQLKRTNARYAKGVISYMSTTSSSSDFDHSSLHPAVIPLTRQFEFIFQERQNFPPKRDTDHDTPSS